MGRKAWVCARRAEQIEIEDCLGDEAVPFLGWEVGVTRGESSAEVIIEGVNRTFSGIAEMGIWGTSWKLTLYLRKAFCMVMEHSLSSMWRVEPRRTVGDVRGKLSRLW